jgi:putative ABC transport system permease protein
VHGVIEMPMVRGRIAKLKGEEINPQHIEPEARWALQSERGITIANEQPEGTRLVEGKWWPKDYDGPVLASFDAALAHGMHLRIGDTMTLEIDDREVTAKIASLRDINWGSLQMNFAIVLTPNAFADKQVPRMTIATVAAEPKAEAEIEHEAYMQFHNVTVVSMRGVLQSAGMVFARFSRAVLLVASLAVVAGLLVMAGAMAASMERRRADSVVLRVLGARRRTQLAAVMIEFLLMGAAVAVAANLLGVAAAYGVLHTIFIGSFVLMPHILIGVTLACVIMALATGAWLTTKTLEVRPLSVLRNE